jgi:hypothetical protein
MKTESLMSDPEKTILYPNFAYWFHQTDDEFSYEYFLSAVANDKLDYEPKISNGNKVDASYYESDDEDHDHSNLSDKFEKGLLKDEFVKYYSKRVIKPTSLNVSNLKELLEDVHNEMVFYIKEHEYIHSEIENFASIKKLYESIGSENIMLPTSF